MVGDVGYGGFASWDCRDEVETEGEGVGTAGAKCVLVKFSISRV